MKIIQVGSGSMTSSSQRSENEKSKPETATEPTPEQAVVTPSGSAGDNPSTSGAGHTAVRSNTPENNLGHINPSAPEDANITPGSAGKK
jgi:hypothetical protein